MRGESAGSRRGSGLATATCSKWRVVGDGLRDKKQPKKPGAQIFSIVSMLGGMVTKEVNGSAAAMLPSARKRKKTGKTTHSSLPQTRL